MSEIYEIPLSNQNPSFSFSSIIKGSTYFFSFKYNTRLELWMVSFKDASENVIVQGVPLFSNRALFQYVPSGIPEVALTVYNTNGVNTDANRFNLGLEVKLIYAE